MNKKTFREKVAGHAQGKIIGTVLFIVGILGLALVEWMTRLITRSDTYYQEHGLPRFLGALIGFAFSFGALRLFMWWMEPTRKESPFVERVASEPIRLDKDAIGAVRYVPYLILVIGLIVAFSS